MGCEISTYLEGTNYPKHTEGNSIAWNIRNNSQSKIQVIEIICFIKIDFGLGRKSTTQLELTIFSGVERESGWAFNV